VVAVAGLSLEEVAREVAIEKAPDVRNLDSDLVADHSLWPDWPKTVAAPARHAEVQGSERRRLFVIGLDKSSRARRE
jgi:hypothetical protein